MSVSALGPHYFNYEKITYATAIDAVSAEGGQETTWYTKGYW
jgi:hypothetical protein